MASDLAGSGQVGLQGGSPLELHGATVFRAHGELPYSGLAGVRETSVQTSPVTGAGIGLSDLAGVIKQVRVKGWHGVAPSSRLSGTHHT